MKSRNGILVLCSHTVEAAKIFRCLTRAGHATIGYGPVKSASSYSRHCAKYIVSQDPKKDIARILEFFETKTITHAIASDDYSSSTLRILRQANRTDHDFFLAPSDRQYTIADDKLAFYAWCQENDFTSPITWSAASYTAGHSHTPVLKRRTGRGGTGYKLFLTKEDAKTAVDRIHDPNAWIVQEYIEGTDVAVNVVCKEGVILSHFTQYCIAQRNKFGPQIITKISSKPSKYLEIAKSVFNKLKWNGPAVLDMRDGQGSVHLLEINSRFGRAVQAGLGVGINLPAALASQTRQFSDIITEDREFVYPSRILQDPKLLLSVKFIRGHRFSSIWLNATDPGPTLAGHFFKTKQSDPDLSPWKNRNAEPEQ